MHNPPPPGPYPPNWPPQHGQPPQYGQPTQQGQPPQQGQALQQGQAQQYPQYGQAPGNYHPAQYPPVQQAGTQPYGPQGYGQPAEGMAVTTRFHPMSFMFALFKPKIVVDGYEVPAAGWGRTIVPVRPGQHHVHVHIPYWLPPRIGPADTVVDVYPGRVAELEYKAPVWGYSAGSLGSPPQRYNGVGITIAVYAIMLAFAILFPLIMVLTNS